MEINSHNAPLVSIVITSYNRANYIGMAIESALGQDYPTLEIIISDNHSTDNTDEVIKRYLHDQRIKYFISDINIGMIPNFKLATERANGEYITYISSDDYLINNSFISDSISLINKHKNVIIVFSRNKTFIEKTNLLVIYNNEQLYVNEYVDGKEVFLNFAKTKGLGWGGTFMNTKALRELNLFDSDITSLDYEANLILMLKGNVGFIKEPTYVVRIHDNQASQQTKAEEVIKNHNFIFNPFQYALTNKIFSKEILEKWKNDLLFLDFRSSALQILPVNKNEYTLLMSHIKTRHPEVYKRLKKNIKWKIFQFLYSRPNFSLKFIGFFSKGHYRNLKALVAKRY